MGDVNLAVSGPIVGIVQAAATLTQALLEHADKELEFAAEPLRSQLIQERLKHQKRANWLLDKMFGWMGYKPDE